MNRTDERAADQFGRLAASLWPGGMDVFGTMDVGLTQQDLDDLAPAAKKVRMGDLGGVEFLAEIAPRLGGGGVRGFLDALDDWEEQDKTSVKTKNSKAVVTGVDLLSEVKEKTPEFFPATEPAEELLGTTLAGFQIETLLGEGSYGRVYKAVQRSLDRHVALKVISPKLQQDEAYVESLQAEAKIAAQLRHPNVVAVIDLGVCPRTSRVFVAFEFVDGESAQDLMRRKGKLCEADALTICLGIAEALVCAEQHGIIHRDVKPDNILIGADGVPKLADLGLARRIEEAGKTTSGFVVGTPHYISPEQALAQDLLDIRTDLYSLGICLYWFTTGQRPFLARTPLEIIARHVNEDVPDPRDVDPAISPRISQLVRWLASRDRDARYGSAKSAVASLKRVLEGKPPLSPHGTGRVIGRKKSTSSGVRSGPTALAYGEAEDEVEVAPRVPPATDRWSRGGGRGFFDDTPGQRVVEGKVAKTGGVGYYDEMLLAPQEHTSPLPESEAQAGRRGRGFYDDASLHESAPDSEQAQDATRAEDFEQEPDYALAQDYDYAPAQDYAYGSAQDYDAQDSDDGAAQDSDDGAAEEPGPAEEKAPEGEQPQDASAEDKESEGDKAPTMILSEDMSRAYKLRRRLGRVPTGKLYDAAVAGDQEFEGFAQPVLSAVVKVASTEGIWEKEQALYPVSDRRLPMLLDAGKVLEKQPYLVFESLEAPPSDRFASEEGPCRFDPATACDVFLNLLESLRGLHTRPKTPLVLCSVKPRGIMLRMPSEDGTLGDAPYLERLAAGHYEPVFADLSCAQNRDRLRADRGKVKTTLGNPLYLPPESAPRAKGGAFVPGTYTAKTDVYGLCLTWYVHLTADRPFGRRSLYELSGLDYLRELLILKRGGVSPVDAELLVAILGEQGEALLPILQQGLHPDPEQRATPRSLLRLARKILEVVETRKEGQSPEPCDSPGLQLRLRQQYFPALVPAESHYHDR